MKLRLQGNSLRLRLTRSEVSRLYQQGVVEETAQFRTGNRLTYRIRRRSGASVIQADLRDGAISVHVPADTVDVWAGSDEVSLNAQDGVLRIKIEKDYRCL